MKRRKRAKNVEELTNFVLPKKLKTKSKKKFRFWVEKIKI